MRILTRYVLLEFLKVFAVSLAAMTVLMLVFGAAREALQQGLGVAQVARLLPYLIPDAMRFAVPGTTLFAACSVYGRLSGANEIVALKALGISPLVVLWPVWVASCLISFAALWLNDVAVSWGRTGIARVVIESVEEIAYSMLRTQRSYSSQRLAINVKGVEGRTLVQPMITFRPGGDQPDMTLAAESAELRANTDENTLTITLRNGSLDIGDGLSISFLNDTIEREIPLPDASNSRMSEAGTSQLPMRVIPEEIVGQTARIENLQQNYAAKGAFQLFRGDFAELAGPRWNEDRAKLQEAEYRLHRLRTEPHRRWANGFSCLCFVLVGAPLAIRLRNSDFLTSFFLGFLPILVVYYPLMAYGVDRAKTGALPPQIVWLGNVILAATGAWLLRKVLRY